MLNGLIESTVVLQVSSMLCQRPLYFPEPRKEALRDLYILILYVPIPINPGRLRTDHSINKDNSACVKDIENFSGVFSDMDVYAKWFLVKDDMSIDLQHGKNLT